MVSTKWEIMVGRFIYLLLYVASLVAVVATHIFICRVLLFGT